MERTQPKSVKPKNETAQIKKRCKLVRGATAKRPKINGCNTRDGCIYRTRYSHLCLGLLRSRFVTKFLYPFLQNQVTFRSRVSIHCVNTLIQFTPTYRVQMAQADRPRCHDVPNLFYIVYSKHRRWPINGTKLTKCTKLPLIRFDPHGTTIKKIRPKLYRIKPN